jgi:DNA-binding transcriptional LysR family regulator
LIAKRAFEMGYCVYASKAFATSHGMPKTYEELSQHRLIQYVESMLHLPWFQWIETYSNKGSHATRVDSTEMALGLVSSGAGIGVLSCSAGDASSDLVRCFMSWWPARSGDRLSETACNSARVRSGRFTDEFFDAQNDKLSGRRPNELTRRTSALGH